MKKQLLKNPIADLRELIVIKGGKLTRLHP